jgi:hypothetical protein
MSLSRLFTASFGPLRGVHRAAWMKAWITDSCELFARMDRRTKAAICRIFGDRSSLETGDFSAVCTALSACHVPPDTERPMCQKKPPEIAGRGWFGV